MVIDTSAVVAMLFDEPQSAALTSALERTDDRLMSCATMLETTIVLESRRATGADRILDAFVKRLRIEAVAFDAEQYLAACDAFRRYGKGRHVAGLNFGDCFAYALAAVRDDVLLFVGDDFRRTDVRAALIQ
ncbi:MAG: type II toxin-antitoxin system VapC family toxin [Myxococcota bacterium]|nr:type II toxin-antitoxin system VapC family toxin [Myxococcota bacterium]